jgi:tyrosinase
VIAMDHFISAPVPLTAAQAAGSFRRAELVFYDVDARHASFTARAFLQAPGDVDLSPDRQDGYAGFFAIFGHGGCAGDEGHCEIPESRDPFDLGPPHPLTPQVKLIDVTERLRQVGSNPVLVVVLAVRPSRDGARLSDVMSFSGVRLLTYA